MHLSSKKKYWVNNKRICNKILIKPSFRNRHVVIYNLEMKNFSGSTVKLFIDIYIPWSHRKQRYNFWFIHSISNIFLITYINYFLLLYEQRDTKAATEWKFSFACNRLWIWWRRRTWTVSPEPCGTRHPAPPHDIWPRESGVSPQPAHLVATTMPYIHSRYIYTPHRSIRFVLLPRDDA